MRTIFKHFAILGLISLSLYSCTPGSDPHTTYDYPETFTISKEDMMDKIKGGWAGQVIGCTYGGPTEFQYNGTMIQDYIPIEWNEDLIEWWYTNAPGLYDDIYMDLTFVQVFDQEGLDAPALSHAKAFANAEYMLWHANQAARYNILNGIEPPASGHWKNNVHSEDLDFQIEADFAGLMSPGMVNSSSEVCDKVGHIMNYGDGWYGGVYVAAMYALSFYSNDIQFIVSEALRTIPEESLFFQCIHDVIIWHSMYPEDWRRTWFEVEKKWSSDIGCPQGVMQPFNIDAKINAAYIVIGMLYGEGDYGKTLDISTRCGQDSDCNPASAGGILGTIMGYDGIPAEWKQGLDRVEDMDFLYTTMSLNDTYEMGFNQALEMIEAGGGSVEGETITISLQEPEAVAFERNLEGHYPTRIDKRNWGGILFEINPDNTEYNFEFEGKGFVLAGGAWKLPGVEKDIVLELDVYMDGELLETSMMPTNYTIRKDDICWAFDLPEGDHKVKIVWTNPEKGYKVDVSKLVVYGPEPVAP
jgi:hypothetical protein